MLEPNSIVVTLDDQPTFAFWYGVWGSGEIAAAKPDITPVNDSLYQFDWYRRLQGELHPDIAGANESVDAILAGNRGVRPIFFTEEPTYLGVDAVEPAGPLWKLKDN
ncbi:MAG: hypothetical protein IPK16_07350 [Anaerolineales bacterium]|nr:hypothetical protein [Anaerolineales bacterium]